MSATERTVVSSYLVLVRDKTERGKSQLKVEYIVREKQEKGEKAERQPRKAASKHI